MCPVQGEFVAALLNYPLLSKSQGAFLTYLFNYLLYFIRSLVAWGVSREGEAFDQSEGYNEGDGVYPQALFDAL